MQVYPKPVIANEELFLNKMDQLVGEITLSTGRAIQVSFGANLQSPSNFISHIKENCTCPGEARISELDERTTLVFNKIIDDVFPIIHRQPLFNQFQQVFHIDDELLKTITRCTSITLIENLIRECDAENSRIIDGIITS